MAICSMSARVATASPNTAPPAFTTKVLPLYMRMYGAALRRARMAADLSGLCMIIGFLSQRASRRCSTAICAGMRL